MSNGIECAQRGRRGQEDHQIFDTSWKSWWGNKVIDFAKSSKEKGGKHAIDYPTCVRNHLQLSTLCR